MAMFKEGKEQGGGNETIVGVDVNLIGNLKSDGNIQINGKVKGKVITTADILVGESALIDGSVKAKNIIITGTIKGNLEIEEDLEIAPTGKIFGDIVTKNLIIKKGSTFIGKSTMPEGELKEKIEPAYEELEKELEKEVGKEEKKS